MAGERVTEEELRLLVEDDPAKPVIHFIEDAHILVDDLLLGQSPTFTEARLKLIEKYMSAHFFLLAEERGGITQEKIGEASQTYATPNKGSGLASTRYGALAISLDPTGILEASLVGGSKKALFRVVGPTPPLTDVG
jgi:hypothetical protein